MTNQSLRDVLKFRALVAFGFESQFSSAVETARYESVTGHRFDRTYTSCEQLKLELFDRYKDREVELTVLMQRRNTVPVIGDELREISSDIVPHVKIVSSAGDQRSIPPLPPSLVVLGGEQPLQLQTDAQRAIGGSQGSWVDVHSAALPFFLPEKCRSWVLHRRGLQLDVSVPETVNTSAFVLNTEACSKRQQIFRAAFWKRLFAEGIPEVRVLDDKAEMKPSGKTLFVFPERLLPVQRAFFNRGLDLLCHLAYRPEGCDLLLFGPNNRDLQKIHDALGMIARRVHAFPLVRGEYSPTTRAIRFLEKNMRKQHGYVDAPPMRFEERQMLFASANQQRAFREVLNNHSYETIVITGAWMMGLLDVMSETERARTRIVCDTHDVFFVMDADANRDQPRYFYSPAKEKERELEQLERGDLVIAISGADATNLRSSGLGCPVVVAPGSFEHSAQLAAGRDGFQRFGFIGSGNVNNQRSVEVLREWWPLIVQEFPSSELLLAGAICEREVAETFAKESKGSVRLLGFIRELGDFYSQIDALLAPITVQGGLNFKCVEALMAGRPVLTTTLGVRCLENDVGVWGSDEAPVDTIRTLQSTKDFMALREAIRSSACNRYSQSRGYEALDNWFEPSAHL